MATMTRILALGLVFSFVAGACGAANGTGTQGGVVKPPATAPSHGHGSVLVGRIVTASNGIVSVAPDGTDRRQLTNPAPPVYDSWPVYSPDGRKIAYSHWDGHVGVSRIYLMNADGSHRHEVPGQPKGDVAGHVSFSADGRRLAYDRKETIWVINLHTGTRREVVKGGYASWSPNGRHIAFVSPRGMITLIRPDGSHRAKLTAGGDPAWAPNGRTIAYSYSDRCGNSICTRIWTINVATHKRRDLTARLSVSLYEPSYAPNGRHLAINLLTRKGYIAHKVATMTMTGRHLTIVAHGDDGTWGAAR